MMTLNDAAGGGYLRAPRIERAELRLLWRDGFWDGPLSGVLVYRDEPCWFEVVFEDEETGERYGVVVRLFKDQLDEESYWNDLFRRHVGTHTDYDERGRPVAGEQRPRDEWAKFYDARRLREPRDYGGNAVLGWFEM